MKKDLVQLTNQIKDILDSSLSLNGRTKNWNNQINLIGNIPELDSMAVMNVVAALETTFAIFFEDEDINAEVFASLQSLTNLIHQKYVSNKQEAVV